MDRTIKDQPWLSSYDPDVPPHLNYPEKPLFALLKESIQEHSQRTALIFYNRKISYVQLGEYIDHLSGALKDAGVKQGDRVAVILPNCPQYVIAYYAVMQLGACVVPVNPLSTERELSHIMEDAQIRMAIALELFAVPLENVRKTFLDAGSSLLERVVYTSVADFLPLPKRIVYRLKAKAPRGLQLRFMALISSAEKIEQVASPNVRSDPGLLVYTGGTTGTPKGILLSHYALVVNALQCRAWVGAFAKKRFLAVLPLFHGFGMSVAMNSILLHGGTVILLPRYQPGEVLRAIHRHRPALFAGVPAMFIGLLNQPELNRYDLSSLRGCFVGGASLPTEVKRQFEKLTGSRVMEGYGLTEAVTAKCANPYGGVNKTGSIGIPFPDTLLRIVDVETGARELEPGEVGEIVVQSPDLMLGYHQRQQETASTLRDGWLYTGDLGYMDEDGYFYVVDRKKDMIITGGFNVYPQEVEEVLHMHPAVKEACVIGLPDDYRGEMVKAFVIPKDNAQVKPDELMVFCRQNLLPYKVPREVELCRDLPKSAIGKVLRRIVKERAVAGK